MFESFRGKNTGYISVITVAEISAGAFLSPRHYAVSKTEEFLAHVQIVELTETIAMEGRKMYAALSNAGKKIEFNDCLIVAIAHSLGMRKIVTRNFDRFNRITGFTAIVPEKLAF